jgi:hypothetical protein
MLTVAISGSFHRHLDAISAAVQELTDRSVRVLSPSDPRIVSTRGDFFFVASDLFRSIRLVQDRHLGAIRAADFVWLVCPDGQVGRSASLELGYAIAAGVPIFSVLSPNDLTLREYVNIVPNLAEALRSLKGRFNQRQAEGLLLNPHDSLDEAHKILDRIQVAVTQPTFAEGDIRRQLTSLNQRLALPSYSQ